MSTTLQLVLSNPMTGMEEEFNRWYGTDHFVHGVLTPGVLAGQRFRRAAGPWPSGKHDYLMIWELGEPAAVLAELAKVKGTDAMPISPAIDMAGIQPPTMWRRAIVYSAARVARESAQRKAIIFGLYNARPADDTAFVQGIMSGGLAKIADEAGVFSAEYLTLADEQIRGNARKFSHGLLIELEHEATAIGSLAGVLDAIPHADAERWMAAVFRPLGARMTKQDAEALNSHAGA
jgi:hypothetical protein